MDSLHAVHDDSSTSQVHERSPLLHSQSAHFELEEEPSERLLSPTQHDDVRDIETAAGDRGAEVAGSKDMRPSSAMLKIVMVLLVGAFTSSADTSLVLATHPTIASEFNRLDLSTWLLTGFALAGSSTQALYGKLSDIYGRRVLLAAAYGLFAAGCLWVGIGASMGDIIAGRAISGSGGGALLVVTSLQIIDIVPLRDVAAWQAGLNLAGTLGRSLGGPVGGWLADTIGWRFSFLGQVPIFIAGMVLCLFYLPGRKDSSKAMPETTPTTASAATETTAKTSQSNENPVSKIDWLGALLLALLTLSFLTPISLGGKMVPWTHPLIFVLTGSGFIFLALFVTTEVHWARDPIFPIAALLQKNIVLSFIVLAAIVAAQQVMMFSVPVYFQVTQRASNTVAGAHLFPAVVGNTAGALLTGLIIKRTGRYKLLTIIATLCSATCYSLVVTRWRGHTGLWESLYIIPGGFGMGMIQTTMFISIQASIESSHKAAAMSAMYLATSFGIILGLASGGAVMTAGFKSDLARQLINIGIENPIRDRIIAEAISSIGYIGKVDEQVGQAIVAAYVTGISFSNSMSLFCSLLAMVAAFFLAEKKLGK